MSEDLYYVLGACADAYIGVRKQKGEYVMEFYQKNRRWLQIVSEHLGNLGHTANIQRYKRRYYRMVVYSKRLYLQLIDARGKLFRTTTEEQELAFIRGFVDAEGSVHKSANRVSIWQKNRKTLFLVRRALEKKGMGCGKLVKSRNVLALNIYGKQDISTFLMVIGFRHPEKDRLLRRKVGLAQP